MCQFKQEREAGGLPLTWLNNQNKSRCVCTILVGFIEGVLQNKISVGRFPFFPARLCTKLSSRFLLMMESMMEVNRADSAVSRSWGHLAAEAFASSTDRPSIPSCRRVATPPELPEAGRVRPFPLRCRRSRTVNGTSFSAARLVLFCLFGAHLRQTDGRETGTGRQSSATVLFGSLISVGQ